MPLHSFLHRLALFTLVPLHAFQLVFTLFLTGLAPLFRTANVRSLLCCDLSPSSCVCVWPSWWLSIISFNFRIVTNFRSFHSSSLTSVVVTMHGTHPRTPYHLACLKRIHIDVYCHGGRWHQLSFIHVLHSFYPHPLLFYRFMWYPCHACITFFHIRQHHRIRLEKLLGTFMHANDWIVHFANTACLNVLFQRGERSDSSHW
jgi:hypothetical protein